MLTIREPNCFSCVCVYCNKEDTCTKKPCHSKEKEVNVYECIPMYPNDCEEFDQGE